MAVGHLRITALGSMGTTVDTFSYGVNCWGPDDVQPTTNSSNSALFTAIANAFSTFHGSAGGLISARALLKSVKFANIGINGKYLNDPWVVTFGTPVGGTVVESGTSVIPQAALAVTLTSGRRGPTGKGRFFVPMPVVSMGSDFLISTANAATFQTRAQTLLNSINSAMSGASLASRVAVVSSKGYASTVTGVQVGRLVDVIRSRRGQLYELPAAALPVT
jgi:hypothetical protein